MPLPTVYWLSKQALAVAVALAVFLAPGRIQAHDGVKPETGYAFGHPPAAPAPVMRAVALLADRGDLSTAVAWAQSVSHWHVCFALSQIVALVGGQIGDKQLEPLVSALSRQIALVERSDEANVTDRCKDSLLTLRLKAGDVAGAAALVAAPLPLDSNVEPRGDDADRNFIGFHPSVQAGDLGSWRRALSAVCPSLMTDWQAETQTVPEAEDTVDGRCNGFLQTALLSDIQPALLPDLARLIRLAIRRRDGKRVYLGVAGAKLVGQGYDREALEILADFWADYRSDKPAWMTPDILAATAYTTALAQTRLGNPASVHELSAILPIQARSDFLAWMVPELVWLGHDAIAESLLPSEPDTEARALLLLTMADAAETSAGGTSVQPARWRRAACGLASTLPPDRRAAIEDWAGFEPHVLNQVTLDRLARLGVPMSFHRGLGLGLRVSLVRRAIVDSGLDAVEDSIRRAIRYDGPCRPSRVVPTRPTVEHDILYVATVLALGVPPGESLLARIEYGVIDRDRAYALAVDELLRDRRDLEARWLADRIVDKDLRAEAEWRFGVVDGSVRP